MSTLIPMVGTTNRVREPMTFTRLLKERIIFMYNYRRSVAISSLQMLHLECEDPSKDIYLYINSPGGVVYSGLAIYDTMQYIRPDVSTICLGMAASMAALLLSAGTPGKRFALPYSRIMIHQPLGGVNGQAKDIEIEAKEILSLKQIGNEILSRHTGQPIEKVEVDTDRNYYMSAEEAKEYGIIDQIFYKEG